MWKRMTFALLALIAAPVVGFAADGWDTQDWARTQLPRTGQWSIVRYSDAATKRPTVCAMEYVANAATFRMLLDPAQDTVGWWIASPHWKFDKRIGDLELVSGKVNAVLQDANYVCSQITHGTEAVTGLAIAEILAMEAKPIAIHDWKGRKLVEFPVSGFESAIGRTQSCADSLR